MNEYVTLLYTENENSIDFRGMKYFETAIIYRFIKNNVRSHRLLYLLQNIADCPPPPFTGWKPSKHYRIPIDAHGICTEILISGHLSLTFQCAFSPTRLSLSYADHRLNFSWKLALLYSGSVCRLNMKFCIFRILYVKYAKIDWPILRRI